MSRKNKGPVIVVHGMQCRALQSEILARSSDMRDQEIIYWRDEHAAMGRAQGLLQAELDKAEATIRNQDVELRRLRAKIAELESR